MNLKNKKELASRVLGIGKERIVLDQNRLEDIQEAITRQDIRDLKKEGVIRIKEKGGRREKEERKTKRREGKRKKKIKGRKRDYVDKVRKQRRYLKKMMKGGEVSKERYHKLRNEVKTRKFEDLRRLKQEIQAEK